MFHHIPRSPDGPARHRFRAVAVYAHLLALKLLVSWRWMAEST